jgi:hypothetical protein
MSDGRTSYLSVSKLTIRDSSFTPLVIAFWHVAGSVVFTGGRLVSGVPDGVVGWGCEGVGTTSGAGFLLQPARIAAATVSRTRVLRIVGPPEFRKLTVRPGGATMREAGPCRACAGRAPGWSPGR